ERRAAFRALQVRHQRRHREARNLQRRLGHFLGVGELRQQLRRHERAHLDVAHTRGVLGLDPRNLQVGRHNRLDALNAVTKADFADLEVFGHRGSPYFPWKRGLRFSLNARTPSCRSSVPTILLYASTSKNSEERTSMCAPKCIERFA